MRRKHISSRTKLNQAVNKGYWRGATKMSEQFDSIMEGLNDLMEYAKGDKTKVCSHVREVPPKIRPVP